MTTFTPPPSPSHGEVAIGGMSLFSFLRQLNERYKQQSTAYTSDACRQLQSDNFRRTEALIGTLEQEHQHASPSSSPLSPSSSSSSSPATSPSTPTSPTRTDSPDVPSSSALTSLVQFFLDTNACTLSQVEESSHRVTQLQSTLDHRDTELDRLRSTLSDSKSYANVLEAQLFDKIREVGSLSEKLISLQARERERGVSHRMGAIQVKEAESRLSLCCVSAKEGMACLEKLLTLEKDCVQEAGGKDDDTSGGRRRSRGRDVPEVASNSGSGVFKDSDEILADVYECLEKIRLVGDKKGLREKVVNWEFLENEENALSESAATEGEDGIGASMSQTPPLSGLGSPDAVALLRTRPRSRTMNLRTALSHLREDLSRTKAEKVEIGAKIGSLFHAVEASKRQVAQLSEANEHLTKENEFLVDQLIRSRLQCKKTEGQLSGICKDISSYISESQDVVHHLNDENSNLLSELLTFRARDNQMAQQQLQLRQQKGRRRRASVHVSPNHKDRKDRTSSGHAHPHGHPHGHHGHGSGHGYGSGGARRRDQSSSRKTSSGSSSRLRPTSTSARKGTRPRSFSRTLPTKRPARGKAGSLPRVQQKRKFGSPEPANPNPLVAGQTNARRKKGSGRFDVSITPRKGTPQATSSSSANAHAPKRSHSDKQTRRRRGSGVKPRRF